MVANNNNSLVWTFMEYPVTPVTVFDVFVFKIPATLCQGLIIYTASYSPQLNASLGFLSYIATYGSNATFFTSFTKLTQCVRTFLVEDEDPFIYTGKIITVDDLVR